jgi:hypothetical protein
MTGNGGGPMPLAEPAVRWSHVTGSSHLASLVGKVSGSEGALQGPCKHVLAVRLAAKGASEHRQALT